MWQQQVWMGTDRWELWEDTVVQNIFTNLSLNIAFYFFLARRHVLAFSDGTLLAFCVTLSRLPIHSSPSSKRIQLFNLMGHFGTWDSSKRWHRWQIHCESLLGGVPANYKEHARNCVWQVADGSHGSSETYSAQKVGRGVLALGACLFLDTSKSMSKLTTSCLSLPICKIGQWSHLAHGACWESNWTKAEVYVCVTEGHGEMKARK